MRSDQEAANCKHTKANSSETEAHNLPSVQERDARNPEEGYIAWFKKNVTDNRF